MTTSSLWLSPLITTSSPSSPLRLLLSLLDSSLPFLLSTGVMVMLWGKISCILDAAFSSTKLLLWAGSG